MEDFQGLGTQNIWRTSAHFFLILSSQPENIPCPSPPPKKYRTHLQGIHTISSQVKWCLHFLSLSAPLYTSLCQGLGQECSAHLELDRTSGWHVAKGGGELGLRRTNYSRVSFLISKHITIFWVTILFSGMWFLVCLTFQLMMKKWEEWLPF